MSQDVRVAWVTYTQDARVWRRKLDPWPDHHPNGMLVEMPGFSGDLRNPDDWQKVNAILASRGVHYDLAAWGDEAGGWVVPILRHR